MRLRWLIEGGIALAVSPARFDKLKHLPGGGIDGGLRRGLQVEAVSDAREQVGPGEVRMVEMALEVLAVAGGIQCDEERKATMARKLWVVLCGEKDPQPIINAGTLYQ